MALNKIDEINIKNPDQADCKQHLSNLRSSLNIGIGKSLINARRRIIQAITDQLDNTK